jgi:hypothetical protein
MELRWRNNHPIGTRLDGTKIVTDYKHVLQYRTKVNAIDYSTADHITFTKWTEWQDVPTVNLIGVDNDNT